MPPDLSFPRSARLLDGAAFGRVFATRSVEQNRYFRIHHAGSASGEARLGLAISRRAAKRAVDRNRIKRLVRESFRGKRAELRALDFVVISRPAATDGARARVRAALMQLWQRYSTSPDDS